MKNNRRSKKRAKFLARLADNIIVKTLAMAMALILLLFSFLLAARGQNPPFDKRTSVETNALMKKPNFQNKGFVETDLTPREENGAVSEIFSAPTAGELDLSLNAAFATYPGSIRASAVQSDGKFLIGGFFSNLNGAARLNIARFNADGSLDDSFNARVSNTIYAIVPQSDGKILIGGNFSFVNGVGRNRVARLNADGSLDVSFNPGGGADNSVFDVAVQPDGKIIIGGFFGRFNGVERSNIARLNADGSLDTSFNANTDGFVYSVAAQSDGKILLGGFFSVVIISNVVRSSRNLARLNADGTLDSTFNIGSGASSTVRKILLQTDGKILIGGAFTSYNGTARNRIARLNPNGSLDTSFNPGTGASSTVWTIAEQTNGKILIGGAFATFNGAARSAVAQLNADGSLDAAFSPGNGFNATVLTARPLPNNKIFVGGGFTSYNGAARDIGVLLNADGSLDASFAIASLAPANLRVSVVQADGKIIVAGTFNRVNGVVRNNIARLNSDGTIDASFNTGTGANEQIYAMVLQPDGKILIGGGFTTYNGISRARIARLNADGALDTSFNPGTGANGSVSGIALQSNGKIIVVGQFFSFNGAPRNVIVRLNADGTVDTSFSLPTLDDFSYLEGVAVQSDGKIVVGGTVFEGATLNPLTRLNSNGSIDNTFVPVTSQQTGVYALALQPDGKVLIGGTFSSIGGINRKGIARLNPNGSLDNSFVGNGTAEGDDVEDIVVLRNGKILIGGTITSINGTARQNIARLNSDGALDATFNASADDRVWDIEVPARTLYNNGRDILISGDFNTVNGVPRPGLARLLIEPLFNRTRMDFDGDGKTDYSVFRPSNAAWYLMRSQSGFAAAQFGIETDRLTPADYDGDGRTDIAVFRSGFWYWLNSSDNAFRAVKWGQEGDIPVPSDTSDDGKADLTVFRPSNGTWYRLDSFDGSFYADQWGTNGDIPIPADDFYASEDGFTVFRPSNGTWYIHEEGDTLVAIQFGQNGDLPVPGDYDGDGKDDIAVYRSGVWYLRRSTQGFLGVQFGAPTDRPVPGDYDGDGKTDIAVWRPSDGTFYVLRSNGNQFAGFQWGTNGDKPIAAAYVP